MTTLFNKILNSEYTLLVLAIVIALVANGCAMDNGLSAPIEISDEVAVAETGSLSITPGNMDETTREAATLQTVLMTAMIYNGTSRAIEFSLPTTSFHGEIGTSLGRTFRFVTYTNSLDAVLGTCDGELSSSSVDIVTYNEVVTLEPGERMELVLSANTTVYADNTVEISMGDGGMLLVDARFADTGDFVPADRMSGNEQLTRLITVELN